MKQLRKKIYHLVQPDQQGNLASKLYDICSLMLIAVSIFPLFFKEPIQKYALLERLVGVLFGVDYLLRFICADFQMKKGWKSFLLYPFTPFALIDLASILPSFWLSGPFLLLRVLRIFRLTRIFRAFRYSRNFRILAQALRQYRGLFAALFSLVIFYVLLTALVMFNIEPETFPSYFDAVYWAATALSTVGYGDICPVTIAGRIVSMVSSLLGIAFIALPAGVIASTFIGILLDKEKTG